MSSGLSMRRYGGALLAIAAGAWLAGCGQEIVVVQCDGHDQIDPDGGTAQADATPGADAQGDAGIVDRGVTDSGDVPGPDGGDAGADPCSGAGYCLEALTASADRVNVREVVTLTPVVRNPGQVALTFSVRADTITTTRKADRPPLELRDVTLELNVDPVTGAASFAITQVPPWFIATTFRIPVFAKGPGAGDPEVFAEAEVHVRGNTAIAGQGVEGVRVYTVASDGRPAAAISPNHNRGELISTGARSPRALLMASDGHLLVYDYGVTPSRILRFELTGENVQVGELAHSDTSMQPAVPYLSDDNSHPYSLAELQDGRIVTVDYSFTRTPRSRVVVWNADGSFGRFITPVNPSVTWSGVGVRDNGELLVMQRDGSNSRVLRIDVASGQELAPDLADTLGLAGRAVLGVPGGDAYASLDGAVMRVSAGNVKIRIANLPGTSSTWWRGLAPYDQGRVLAINDTSGEVNNIAIIENRDFVEWLRPSGAGGLNGSVYGVAYLE